VRGVCALGGGWAEEMSGVSQARNQPFCYDLCGLRTDSGGGGYIRPATLCNTADSRRIHHGPPITRDHGG